MTLMMMIFQMEKKDLKIVNQDKREKMTITTKVKAVRAQYQDQKQDLKRQLKL